MSYRQFVAQGPLNPMSCCTLLKKSGSYSSVARAFLLPTFAGLVDEVFDEFAITCHPENLDQRVASVPDDPVLGAAYRREEYDKALNILEDREGGTGELRRFVMKRLTRKPSNEEALALHRAVLDLTSAPAGSLLWGAWFPACHNQLRQPVRAGGP